MTQSRLCAAFRVNMIGNQRAKKGSCGQRRSRPAVGMNEVGHTIRVMLPCRIVPWPIWRLHAARHYATMGMPTRGRGEMADAQVLGTCGAIREGSTPSVPTIPPHPVSTQPLLLRIRTHHTDFCFSVTSLHPAG